MTNRGSPHVRSGFRESPLFSKSLAGGGTPPQRPVVRVEWGVGGLRCFPLGEGNDRGSRSGVNAPDRKTSTRRPDLRKPLHDSPLDPEEISPDQVRIPIPDPSRPARCCGPLPHQVQLRVSGPHAPLRIADEAPARRLPGPCLAPAWTLTGPLRSNAERVPREQSSWAVGLIRAGEA